MARCLIIALILSMVAGCGAKTCRMEHPEDTQGRYRDQISAAKRCLEQNENWADRVDWEVSKSGDGWEVTAWRIEHPERTGPSRYLPWGYSVIKLDSRMVTVHYRRKG
jgi:hypothetical protein